ncbi:MAG: hypothetical protein ACK2UL_01775, partial [Anaerolineae bacterium]
MSERTTITRLSQPSTGRRRRLAAGVAATLAALATSLGLAAAQAPATIAAGYPIGMLVPDSELVYGPTTYGFDVTAFVSGQGGYLAAYTETIGGETLTGAQMVDRVAEDYSVGPRTLLALIEAHSGWVSGASPDELRFPLPESQPGLYSALTSASDSLNHAYYRHKNEGDRAILLADGAAVEIRDANSGTFAVMSYLTRGETADSWAAMAAPSRFYVAWNRLFGDAYRYRVVETVPESLPQQELSLPFADGEIWYYVAGPHSPWGTGAPRAAI